MFSGRSTGSLYKIIFLLGDFDGSYNLFQLCCKGTRRGFLTRKFAINHFCQQRGNSGEERVFVNVPDLYSLNYVMQLFCFYFKVYDCVSLMNINEAHEEREKSRSM